MDEDFGTIRVKRFQCTRCRPYHEGKDRPSQIIGGVIFGIGAALMEATEYDKRWGNPVTRTLADYHVPVHLDVPPIDVHLLENRIHTFRLSAPRYRRDRDYRRFGRDCQCGV
ncbi:molybdopterin-dependent oxidoreductase [Chitinophaga pinensis]|uniref:Molybdopterin-dependent oxidoreductase n=1 Tax=Chitinophaga pinensis TaxID=79329 RepID=A0A5C6LN78_9BACT|nr:molybdopterin-dependent oxidoreductase [Chitinophaga pinensis]